MAIIKAVKSHGSIRKIIKYVTQEEKTLGKYLEAINCHSESAIEEMVVTKQMYGKMAGVQYYHYIQSFPSDEKISPEQANSIAKELAEEQFPGHEVLIATHVDREHIHSHIIVNSVSLEDGKKLQFSPKDLRNMKERNNEMCIERGLSIPVKGKEITTCSQNKYMAILRGVDGKYKSHVLDTAIAVSNSIESAIDREDFITIMDKQGYQVNWKDNRKYITFTDSEGHKVRDCNIEKTFKIPVSKEVLNYEFTRNKKRKRDGNEGEQREGAISKGTKRDFPQETAPRPECGQRQEKSKQLDSNSIEQQYKHRKGRNR